MTFAARRCNSPGGDIRHTPEYVIRVVTPRGTAVVTPRNAAVV
jgi:hypothetical protein